VLAVRLLSDRQIARVTGVDLANWLLTSEDLERARVFLLGTPASVAELQGRHPLRVVGRWGAGSADRSDDVESIARIRERGANVVLVGYGAPEQVIWIQRNRVALTDAGVRVVIGVGGALDYLAGTVSRAPAPIRALGLEWAYRLVREPWRWRRQLALPRFAYLVARSWFGQVESKHRR
jgi:N-acetylglucosaminyldiphosphoundecaprenol N-acetyl-beta-D-mannosaminyltransferase